MVTVGHCPNMAWGPFKVFGLAHYLVITMDSSTHIPWYVVFSNSWVTPSSWYCSGPLWKCVSHCQGQRVKGLTIFQPVLSNEGWVEEQCIGEKLCTYQLVTWRKLSCTSWSESLSSPECWQRATEQRRTLVSLGQTTTYLLLQMDSLHWFWKCFLSYRIEDFVL